MVRSGQREFRALNNVRLIIPERFAKPLREAIPEFIGQISFSE